MFVSWKIWEACKILDEWGSMDVSLCTLRAKLVVIHGTMEVDYDSDVIMVASLCYNLMLFGPESDMIF